MFEALQRSAMGNCCVVKGAVDHWIYVKIGDRKQPLSDAKLRMIVQDISGRRSPALKLDCILRNEFERHTQVVFEVSRGDVHSAVCVVVLEH